MGEKKQKVTLYSDGAARGNPGPGGWGVVLTYVDSKGVTHEKEMSEGYPETTNNRMELTGVIRGLQALKRPCRVEVVSDSQYVVKAFNDGWMEGWLLRDFHKKNGDPVLNDDLWRELLQAAAPHEVTWTWVKGHDGHPMNERCDKLATEAADRAKKEG